MTNEEKAKEISNSMSFCKDRILLGCQSAMEMAKWKDEQAISLYKQLKGE